MTAAVCVVVGILPVVAVAGAVSGNLAFSAGGCTVAAGTAVGIHSAPAAAAGTFVVVGAAAPSISAADVASDILLFAGPDDAVVAAACIVVEGTAADIPSVVGAAALCEAAVGGTAVGISLFAVVGTAETDFGIPADVVAGILCMAAVGILHVVAAAASEAAAALLAALVVAVAPRAAAAP